MRSRSLSEPSEKQLPWIDPGSFSTFNSRYKSGTCFPGKRHMCGSYVSSTLLLTAAQEMENKMSQKTTWACFDAFSVLQRDNHLPLQCGEVSSTHQPSDHIYSGWGNNAICKHSHSFVFQSKLKSDMFLISP